MGCNYSMAWFRRSISSTNKLIYFWVASDRLFHATQSRPSGDICSEWHFFISWSLNSRKRIWISIKKLFEKENTCFINITVLFEAKQYQAVKPFFFRIRQHITVTTQLARWRLKSPASRWFAQPCVQAQIIEMIKALRHWPLWRESAGSRKGHWRGKCCHVMMSSWTQYIAQAITKGNSFVFRTFAYQTWHGFCAKEVVNCNCIHSIRSRSHAIRKLRYICIQDSSILNLTWMVCVGDR